MNRFIYWLAAASILATTACAEDPGTDESSPNGISIVVAPLGLEDVTDACYRLTISNGDTEQVWQRENICATQFGDLAASISYVGTCDASDGVSLNTVRLELEEMYSAPNTPVDRDSYQNPCGHADNGNDDGGPPCELEVECVANTDARVTFNITVLRDAQQGFFDIAVNFDDIFCSSKLDTCNSDDVPIELLFNPATGERGQTAVLALACTSGPGLGGDTVLHMNPILVRCDKWPDVLLDPTVPAGNAWNATNPDPVPTDPVWQYAVYRGAEDLNCGTESCQKLYWNVAIGFDPTAPNCNVFATATASDASQMVNGLTPASSTYPVITFGLNEGQ
jgi:hypothetical protein